jgi:hypothetical protein
MRSSSARLAASRASVSGPLVAEHLDPQWVGQMHPGPARLEEVSGPVPAVGRLEHDLRVRAGLGQLQRQRHRIVVDPDGLQHLTLAGQAHDHRAAAVQVDPDIGLPMGPPSSWLV